MSLKGNLETFYLNSILQLLHNDKKTGVFKASRAKETIQIYFQEGAVIYAMGSAREGRLGFLLKKKGFISGADLKECIRHAKDNKMALGKHLVEQGHITEEVLKEVLKQQTEEIILNLFFWEKGDFEYRDATLNIRGMVHTRINVMKIMLEASRRIDEMSVFKKLIPNQQLVLARVSPMDQRKGYQLTAAELGMLDRIDGKKNIHTLFSESDFDSSGSYDEFSAYKILHTLITSGLVKKRDESNSGSRGPSGKPEFDYAPLVTVYNDLVTWLCRTLETEIGNQVLAIFSECKDDIELGSEMALDHFHPENPAANNINHIMDVVEKAENRERSGIEALNLYFQELLSSLLNQTSLLLGDQYAGGLIEDLSGQLVQTIKSQGDNPNIQHPLTRLNRRMMALK